MGIPLKDIFMLGVALGVKWRILTPRIPGLKILGGLEKHMACVKGPVKGP